MPAPPPLDFPFASPPAFGETMSVAPGIRWIRMPLPFALDHINLWLLDGATPTLVDCGYGDSRTRGLWERLLDGPLAGARIAQILVTHCHPDHVGNAAWLAPRFGAPVAMTHAEFLTTHALAQGHAGHGPENIVALFVRHGLSGEDAAALSARGNHYRRGVPDVPSTFSRLLDGQVVGAGRSRWRVVEGHGHSPEHASLFAGDDRVLISGDMLLPTISTNISVWSIEPEADSLGRFLDSLTAFEGLPDDTLVLPSHGLPFRGIAARVAQLRTHHRDRLDELVSAIRGAEGPVTAGEIVPVLFRRKLDLQQLFFAMGEAIAHLNHLWHAGRVKRIEDADGRLRFAIPG